VHEQITDPEIIIRAKVKGMCQKIGNMLEGNIVPMSYAVKIWGGGGVKRNTGWHFYIPNTVPVRSWTEISVQILFEFLSVRAFIQEYVVFFMSSHHEVPDQFVAFWQT
jgi:hypothetical protein